MRHCNPQFKGRSPHPRDLEGESHLIVEELTEHVRIAAMYATTAASCLWEDRPSPPLAQAARDAPNPGPTAEEIHPNLHIRAAPKTPPCGPPHPARRLGRNGSSPGHHESNHPQTPGHLVERGEGRPRQGQKDSGARPR